MLYFGHHLPQFLGYYCHALSVFRLFESLEGDHILTGVFGVPTEEAVPDPIKILVSLRFYLDLIVLPDIL